MASKIFINIAVKNLEASKAFFLKLGFTFNPQFTDDKSACMIVGENIFTMLIQEERFKDFTKKELCNAQKYTEVLLSIDVESREKVDELVKKAIEAGGKQYMEPQDYGWMYGHSFADLDGHQWDLFYMNESEIPQ